MRHDLLADALSNITNAIRAGKKECTVKPVSKLLMKVLDLFKKEGYIENYEYSDNKKGGIIKIILNGRINKCFAIKPRFSAKKDEIEKFEKRYLPGEEFGILILSSPQGLMTHQELKEKNLGGKLIAYVY
ncbi:30S ribosomal protein S8 [archaeon CG07_land_8_20_14_0_80_38_8]|nr:MAG: 30S ribosomal protein S8 [archaeon CG07_land_8_20_14_0_80_38_8]PIU88969.1 MAG: 30S ribosomal protein S8 [archaeon CG06_land_8_20_14_3_00_37_11]